MNDDDEPLSDLTLAVLEEQADATIRRAEIAGVWYFSVVDVIAILTDAPKPRQYWFDMKRYVKTEGFIEVSEKVRQLKLAAADGKERVTDAADLETMLRIVQSVPSPKAEPIKQWLAKVGAKEITGTGETTAAVLDPSPITVAWASKPADGDLIAWADWLEKLAVIFRQQASQEERLQAVEAVTSRHDSALQALQFRMDSLEEAQAQLPDMLAMLRPERLSPLHQEMLRQWTGDLSRLSGWPINAIYQDMLAEFGIGGLDDAHERDWTRIADWFQTRLEAVRKRR